MNSFLKNLFSLDKKVKIYFVFSLIIIILSYLVYLFFDENTVNKLGAEDSFFENLTAISFLFASIIFIIIFFLKKKIIYLVFAVIFFIGMGEEISWGQRIFNYKTPEYFEKNNIQDEFNFHNLNIFDSKNNNGQYKAGLSYILSVNFLYKLFWLVYGVIFPVVYLLSRFVKKTVDKIDVPVPPFVLGIIFLINWLLSRLILSYLLPDGRSLQYYYTAGEISEFGSAFIFMILGAYFLQTAIKKRRLTA